MAHHVFYGSYSNFKYRLIKLDTEEAWNFTDEELQATVDTYAETAQAITRDDDLAGFPITVPSGVPVGWYDLLVYDVASPANTDNPVLGKRVYWTTSDLINVHDI